MASRLHLNTIALEPNRWNKELEPAFNIVKLLPLIAESGFSHVEVWEGHIANLSGRTIQDVQSLADALNIHLTITGIYPVMHLQGKARSEELTRTRGLMTKARKLGSDTIKFFVGTLPSAIASSEERDRSVSFLQEMVHHADVLSVTLAGEFHMNTLFDTVESTRDILRLVPELKVCFQPFDFSSTTATIADFNSLRRHVVHMHLQGRRGGEFATLRDADIDYEAFFREIAKGPYSGDFGIEFVVGCVTDRVDDEYLGRVLEAAETDATFVRDTAATVDLDLVG
jgi:sugar phosphate isomerase/epimerase